MNRLFRSQRRRVLTERFTTRRSLRSRQFRLLRTAAKRASQDS